MVLKQLEDGKFTYWCPGCNDLHVLGSDYTVSGPYERPTVRPAVYEWDEHIICHASIDKGKMRFHPDTTHELSEQTVPMCPVPIWLEDAPETDEYADEDDLEDGFYYPNTDEDEEIASTEDDDYLPEEVQPSLWLDGRKHG